MKKLWFVVAFIIAVYLIATIVAFAGLKKPKEAKQRDDVRSKIMTHRLKGR